MKKYYEPGDRIILATKSGNEKDDIVYQKIKEALPKVVITVIKEREFGMTTGWRFVDPVTKEAASYASSGGNYSELRANTLLNVLREER